MDDLSIEGEVVNQTLKELNTINQLLGGNVISVSAFKRMATQQPIKLGDLGCGGGDIMIEMAKWARRKKINVSFVGIDANPHIVAYASDHTKEYPEIKYQALNILSDEFKNEQFDILHCCLFIHHFSDEQLIDLFRHFKTQTKIAVIINDLHRHPLAYWSIKMLTYLFSRSRMVRNDAAVSVARGFKKKELINILNQAGIEKYNLSWHWAFRWKLIF